jgi:hypothetical protein
MKQNLIRDGLLAACICLGAFATVVQAADQSVVFLEGKVWTVKGVEKVATTNEIVFPGDIKINTNGVFTVKGGKERQLKSEQILGSDGMLTSPDGTVVPVQDHLAMRRGRVYLVKDGEATSLAAEYRLPDGSKVKPGGEIIQPSGTVRRMLDGQTTKLDGTAIPATDTASLQDGKVTLFKDGGRIVLRRDQVMSMSDGTRVSGDGKVVRPDGRTEMLKEGEILKLQGVVSPKK